MPRRVLIKYKKIKAGTYLLFKHKAYFKYFLNLNVSRSTLAVQTMLETLQIFN